MVEVLFLIPNQRNQLEPVYRTFNLDSEGDLIDWRLSYKATCAIQAKIRIIDSRRVNEEEFIRVDNERKALETKVAAECCAYLKSQGVQIDHDVHKQFARWREDKAAMLGKRPDGAEGPRECAAYP